MNSIIFDMDGTLFDTERLMLDCWKTVADRYGMPEAEAVYPLVIGLDKAATMALLRDHYGDAWPLDRMRDEIFLLFRERIDREGLPVKPGAREVLSYLREQGCALALASSTAGDIVERELNQTGLRRFFDAVIGGDAVANGKPAPDIFLLACERLGSRPAETYVVEDSPNGIRAAHAAGAIPLMVPDMIPPDREIRGLCRQVLPDLTAVQEYFHRL